MAVIYVTMNFGWGYDYKRGYWHFIDHPNADGPSTDIEQTESYWLVPGTTAWMF